MSTSPLPDVVVADPELVVPLPLPKEAESGSTGGGGGLFDMNLLNSVLEGIEFLQEFRPTVLVDKKKNAKKNANKKPSETKTRGYFASRIREFADVSESFKDALDEFKETAEDVVAKKVTESEDKMYKRKTLGKKRKDLDLIHKRQHNLNNLLAHLLAESFREIKAHFNKVSNYLDEEARSSREAVSTIEVQLDAMRESNIPNLGWRVDPETGRTHSIVDLTVTEKKQILDQLATDFKRYFEEKIPIFLRGVPEVTTGPHIANHYKGWSIPGSGTNCINLQLVRSFYDSCDDVKLKEGSPIHIIMTTYGFLLDEQTWINPVYNRHKQAEFMQSKRPQSS